MIDLTQLQDTGATVNVEPSNGIFDELGRNTYDYKDLLSELIDNCLAAKVQGQQLDVIIDIYVDSNGAASDFIIRDNATGIPHDKLGLAITPAGKQSENSLNEHGLGMKQAVAALGKLCYLATKTEDENDARVVREFRFGDIDEYHVQFDQTSGTEIAITALKPIVTANAANYTKSIVPYIGARYRRFLKPHNKSLELTINIRSLEHPSDVQYTWPVTEVKPIYFHPSTRHNEPVITAHRIEGTGWAAELTFGYAPSNKAEYEELGLDEPTKFNPYKVSLSNQGLDVISRDRVILFHQLSELGIVSARHNDYNNIRGEIDLKHGFATAITKNSVIMDTHFVECITLIKEILNGQKPGPNGKVKNYIVQKSYPDELPEKLLRDRLIEWLENNPMLKRHDVKREYAVGGIEGNIDILADGEAWELKIGQASAYDVYQLFMYMDIGDIKKGFLVAQGFTTGSQIAAEHIKESHAKEIVLANRSSFPINHPPTENERSDYY